MESNITRQVLDNIQAALTRIEREHEVRILYACESGSRAWGFASPDSDYDVRFIYAHTKDWYLDIEDKKDVIELPVNEVLDVGGWDIRKALRLFRSSNAALYEWLQSPITYRNEEAFTTTIRGMMPTYFSLRAGAHHYISMALNTLKNELQGTEVRLKKYFYALRPLLAAKWILERNELPPMEFGELRAIVADSKWQEAVDELLQQKSVSGEKALIPPIPLLQHFIEREISACEDGAKQLKRKETDIKALNELFRMML